MIETYIGDIFDSEANIIVHQCNCFHTMGGGIAKVIADKYPDAKLMDDLTPLGTRKLGTYSFAFVDDKKRIIINMYSQGKYGKKAVFTDYKAMKEALISIRDCFIAAIKEFTTQNDFDINNIVLGIPYLIGCGLGGGDWNEVEKIINEVFGNVDFRVMICKLPEIAQDAAGGSILI